MEDFKFEDYEGGDNLVEYLKKVLARKKDKDKTSEDRYYDDEEHGFFQTRLLKARIKEIHAFLKAFDKDLKKINIKNKSQLRTRILDDLVPPKSKERLLYEAYLGKNIAPHLNKKNYFTDVSIKKTNSKRNKSSKKSHKKR